MGYFDSRICAGESFSYTYDDVGNIVSVTRGAYTAAYAYDNLGQLIRSNDPEDPAAGSGGTTWVYEYDCGGNILSRKKYAYTHEEHSCIQSGEIFSMRDKEL